ncbi:MAG: T9SS type A sorting domain-containing protein [Calditrichaceae bacterium]|nr:T9SS type A sorting domain-containing protein [Calditrichaceae bacterium]
MKKIISNACLSLFFLISVHAQEPSDDPLEDSYTIQTGGGAELVTFSGSTLEVYKYFEEMTLYSKDTLLQVLSNGLQGGDYHDICIASFDNDEFEEIAVSVILADNHAGWSILKADPSLLSIEGSAEWDTVISGTISGSLIFDPDDWSIEIPVLIKGGNFDGDPQSEFAMAYLTADSQDVRILVYDVSDAWEVSLLGEISDQKISMPPEVNLCEDYLSSLYEIECADLNGDGLDEVLLTGRNGVGDTGWEIFVNIYALDTTAAKLVSKSHTVLFSRENNAYDIGVLNIATGNFITNEKKHGVVGFFQYCPEAYSGLPADTISYTLIPFEANESLNDVTAGNAVYTRRDTIPIECWYDRYSTLICNDVNNDGIEEIISTFSFNDYDVPYNIFTIFKGALPLDLTLWADIQDIDEDVGRMTVGDIKIGNEDSTSFKEVTITTRGYPDYHSYLYQIQYDQFDNFSKLQPLDQMTYLEVYKKSEGLQSANLDADIKLGKPSRYSATAIIQPLVILNAPPIHFDVFGGTSYDVSLSYNENESDFISHYEKESSQSTEVSTEFTQDWGLSQSLHAGGSYWGVSVSAYLTETYGKRFSKSGGYSTTVTVSIAVDAKEDDRIYATVVDYDIWEYPVYANSDFKGNVMVVRPVVTENRWFPSKSWSGYSYIPTHEVGNILSYREYPLLSDNPEVDELIKGDYSNSFTLDANSSYDWALLFEEFETNEASTEKSYSREWGASVDVWGCGYSINGSYSKNEIYTHKTDVSSGLELSVHLDGVDMGLGEVSYRVTPYTYWAANGALVIDYAVRPELAEPAGTLTWWQNRYGQLADPAFILPWRLDPEKGFMLEEDIKRMQTKDLAFFPSDPKEGDIILIRARIHNFSLIPTPHPMGVTFYIGNPDSGGTLIIGTKGESEVFTDKFIDARGSEMVEMHWQIPSGIGSYPRIYAVIDEDNVLPEIHENNNKSWAILKKTTSTAMPSNKETGIPKDYALLQNYPNPFNPETTIEFAIPSAQQVRLDVFNLLGEYLVNIVDAKIPAGSYAYRFNAGYLASGIYYYRISTKDFCQTRKMILLR